MPDRTANDRRMTMNDLCDEIFNSRLPGYQTCPPFPGMFREPPCECHECGAPLESGDETHCEDCS
jgi:hypothetical protein